MSEIFSKYYNISTLMVVIVFFCFCSCAENKIEENTKAQISDDIEEASADISFDSTEGLQNELIFPFNQEGIASWYGEKFDGRVTASGEICSINEMVAGHKILPFGSLVKITDTVSNNNIIVKINDRGPSIEGRIINMSRSAAERLNIIEKGLAKVKINVINSD